MFYGIGCSEGNVQIDLLRQIGDASYYWTEVSEGYPFLSCEIVVRFCFCFLGISLVLRLFMVFMGYPFFLAIASIAFHSSCFDSSVMGSGIILCI